MPRIPVCSALSIDDADVRFSFVRSPGPGGQHVNKVATAAQLRFDTNHLPGDVRQRLLGLAAGRMAADGVLLINAHRFRSQDANRCDALDRLRALLAQAAQPPPIRRATRPSRAAARRRLAAKKRHAEVKQLRRSEW